MAAISVHTGPDCCSREAAVKLIFSHFVLLNIHQMTAELPHSPKRTIKSGPATNNNLICVPIWRNRDPQTSALTAALCHIYLFKNNVNSTVSADSDYYNESSRAQDPTWFLAPDCWWPLALAPVVGIVSTKSLCVKTCCFLKNVCRSVIVKKTLFCCLGLSLGSPTKLYTVDFP